MMTATLLDPHLDATRGRQTTCMTLAIGIHALMLLWNPVILQSHYKPIHDFVTVDVVEQQAPGSPAQAEAPKKMSLFESLKDMLMKPKTEEIAHVAPTEPLAQRVAAPVRPQLLQEKQMPRPISTTFQPKSTIEDIASANAPNAIQTQAKNFALPAGGPTLQSKSFGGIRAKDLPFQVGTDQSIAGGAGAAVIPIAVGNKSAKSALGYGSASLTDAGKRHMGIQTTGLGAAGNVSALGAGGSSTIEISGTGGTGNAPTGATHGNVLTDRAGSGGGGFGRFGGGRGGGGYGGGISGIPSAAVDLDAQLTAAASGGGRGKQVSKKSFEIAGPLNNRAILRKTVPQYPAWAEEQGIIGSVRIYFTVASDGAVRSNMRVTKTTGYPELDKLAMDALKDWRFAPFQTEDESSQWGIITFTFSLSS